MLRSLIQRLKPLATRRHLWFERAHAVLLDRWQERLYFSLDQELAALLLRRRPLSFVQIGACDGLLDDPLEPYIRAGCLHGLLVEPQPEAFASLQERYAGNPAIALANCAVAAEPGHLELTRLRASHRHLLLSHAFGMASARPAALREALGRVTERPDEALETIIVEALDWQQLFERHGVTQVDLLQIDTEGLDGVLLEAYPLESMPPLLIQFEWVHIGEPDLSRLLGRLMDQGYRLHQSGIDMMASRREEIDKLPLLPLR